MTDSPSPRGQETKMIAMRDCENIQKNIISLMGSLGAESFKAFERHLPYIQQTMDMLADDESKQTYAREIIHLMLLPYLKDDLPYRFAPMSRPDYQKMLARGHELNLHPEMQAPPNGEYVLRQSIVHTFYNEQYAYADKVGIEHGDICLDIGAFVGDTAIWMLDRGAGFVFSFEIDRKLQNYLLKNIEKNSYGHKFQLVPHAASAKNEELFYMPHPDNPGAGRILDARPDSGNAYKINAITLDEFCARNFITPNFIKMDIEGAEPAAIAGARGVFAAHRPKFAICIYHKTEHRWQVPLALKEICEDYEFHVKKSSYDCETVLLGKPAKSGIYPINSYPGAHAHTLQESCPSEDFPPKFTSFREKKEYFKHLAGKYSRAILTGFVNSRHTHRYIHEQWRNFLLKMGVECLWIDHPNQIETTAIPGSLIVVPDDHLAKIYPVHINFFNKDYSYLLHQGKYVGHIPQSVKYLKLLEYRNIFANDLDKLYEPVKIKEYVRAWAKPHILMQPWGCPLLATEFRSPVTSRSNSKIYFIGAKWSGNETILDRIGHSLHKAGFDLIIKSNVTAGEEERLIRQSYCAIAPGAANHVTQDYLTCKVFKDIAYGRLTFTDINAFAKILGNAFIPITSFADAVKITSLLPEATENSICQLQQQAIVDYTYLDMWINIMFYMDKFNQRKK